MGVVLCEQRSERSFWSLHRTTVVGGHRPQHIEQSNGKQFHQFSYAPKSRKCLLRLVFTRQLLARNPGNWRHDTDYDVSRVSQEVEEAGVLSL